MRTNEDNFFNSWKEFTIKKPDEMILNHLDIVKNHTTLDGYLKHNNKEIIKVFSLFITHNYGSHIYELCNFLKYLNQIKFSFYNVMVLSSSEITQRIKKIEFTKSDQLSPYMTLKIEKHTFNLHYNRISTYIIILDFIEEFLGIDEIYFLDDKISKLASYKELKQISNDISKKIYVYFKDLLPSSYLQNFSTIIGNEIIKENNDEDHDIVSADITDEFILNFWINYNSNKSDFLVKTYPLAASLCIIYKRSIDINKLNSSSFVDNLDVKDAWANMSREDVDNFLEELVENSNENIFSSINKLIEIQEQKINLLKKKDINELLIFLKYQKTSLELSLTIFRICIFGNIQNKISESERRKNANFDNIRNIFDTALSYQDQFQIYNKLIMDIDFINGIIFYKLWIFDKIEYFAFIRDFLNESEILIFNEFIEKQKNHNQLLNEKVSNQLINQYDEDKINIENISKKFKQKLKHNYFKNNLSNFEEFLEKLKFQSRSFRRNGFEFKSANDKNFFILGDLYKSLTEIKKFLNEFLNTVNDKGLNLKNQLDQDKKLFFNQFKNLYLGK